jgi:hypothetical protein
MFQNMSFAEYRKIFSETERLIQELDFGILKFSYEARYAELQGKTDFKFLVVAGFI